MHRIAILGDNVELGRQIVRWTECFFLEQGCFPMIKLYENCELFYETMRESLSCGVIVALSGVRGLNVVEHLRSLNPDCRLIWCSDLDFSLHAYRVWTDYFILYPVTEEEMKRGLSVWQSQDGNRSVFRTNSKYG